jgi:hypothetical protein
MSTELEWVQQVIQFVKRIAPKEFYGSIQINLQGGGVSNVNLTWSVKPE